MLSLATTRLITHHISGDKSILASLSDRFDYGQNPEKTPGRVPDPLLRVRPPHRRQRVSFEQGPVQIHYRPGAKAGRRRAVLSDPPILPPGELDPEEALNIGYELAMRWTKGNHAFFVVSHADRPTPRPYLLQFHHS